jgi:hypothetical protein
MTKLNSQEQTSTETTATLYYDPISCYSWLEFLHQPPTATRDELHNAGWRWRGYREAWSTNERFPRFPETVALVMGGAVNYAEERSDRLSARAERHSAEAERHYEASNQIASMIPMGQPILVGHHSEKRHRRDLARIEAHMDHVVEEHDKAKRLEERAEGSAHHQAYVGQARLISQRLEADKADLAYVQQHPQRYRPTQHALLIAYFTQRVEIQTCRLAEAGGYTPPTAESVGVQPGDIVEIRSYPWPHLVKRVNAKSLSVVYQDGERRHSGTAEFKDMKRILSRCPEGKKPCLICEWGSVWVDDRNERGYRIGGHRETCQKCAGTGYVNAGKK